MVLTKEELKKLQTLSHIQLDEQEETKLGDQLQDIIAFLGELKNIDVDDIDMTQMDEETLEIIKGVKQTEKPKELLQNVEHEMINNSIVIKSVLS